MVRTSVLVAALGSLIVASPVYAAPRAADALARDPGAPLTGFEADGALVRAFEARDPARVERVLDAMSRPAGVSAEAWRFVRSFVTGSAALEAGRAAEAADALARAYDESAAFAAGGVDVGDYAALGAARAALAAGRTADARRFAEAVDAGSRLAEAAALVTAQSLLREQNAAAAGEIATPWVEREGPNRAAWLWIAARGAAAAGERAQALRFARTLLFDVTDDPAHPALAWLDEIGAPLTPGDRAERGSRLYDRAPAAAAAVWRALIDTLGRTPRPGDTPAANAARCTALWGLARGTLTGTRSADEKRIAALNAACTPAGADEAALMYGWGRKLVRAGDNEGAYAAFGRAVRRDTAGVYGHRARVEWSKALRRAGRVGEARTMIDAVAPAKLPPAERPAALWMQAWTAYRAGDYPAALKRFAVLADGPGPNRRRALYWQAVCELSTGVRGEAAERFAEVDREAPYSLYALFARRRLSDAKADRILADLDREERIGPGALAPAPLSPAVAKARLLAKLGVFAAQAQRELVAAIDGAAPEALASVAVEAAKTAAGMGKLHTQVGLMRSKSDVLGRLSPRGAAEVWRLAYPRPYESAVTAAVKANPAGPPDRDFLWALMREESAFNPEARSRAGAFGLTQVMPATARHIHREIKTPPRFAFNRLKEPELAARYGAHFLHRLFSRLQGNPVFVLAAYNAGPGAAKRWMTRNAGLPLDEWVEEIPFEETYFYVRRVMQSYAVYRALDGRPLPVPSFEWSAPAAGERTVEDLP